MHFLSFLHCQGQDSAELLNISRLYFGSVLCTCDSQHAFDSICFANVCLQSCSAIVYEGFETLTAVGVNISEFYGIRAIVGGYNPLLPQSGNCFLPNLSVS